MKILHLISSSGMYGAEAVILSLCRCLNGAGHSSSIAAFTNERQPNLALHAAAEHAGVRMDAVACAGQVDRRTPGAIRTLARTVGAGVVHAHGYKADLYAALAMRRSGIPVVSTCHTWYDNDAFVRMYGAVDRWALRGFAGVVAVSEGVRQRLLRSGVDAAKIRLIPNGIDPAPFAGSTPGLRQGELRVGLVGRLAPEKGIDLFLAAAARVLRVLPEVRFVVVGDGPERVKLEAMVRDLGLAQWVTLAGRNDDMPAFFGSLDVLVSASRLEGLPIALLEGMASALPVVATRAGEVPRLVQEGTTGMLVPIDDEAALAQAIETMACSRELRRRYGEAGRQRIVEQYSAERMSGAYLGLYRDIAQSVVAGA